LSKELKNFLEKKRKEILKEWKEVFWDSFGEEASRFFKKEVDRFQNPFGYRIDETFNGLIEIILGEFDWDKANYYLDRLIQMRTVQETLPSKGLHLFLQLKSVIRKKIGNELIKKFGVEELLRIEDKINVLMLKAMDYYVKYKETLERLRYEEWKRAYFLLLKRAGLVYDPMEGMPKSNPKGN